MKNQEPERGEAVLDNDIKADAGAFAEADNFNGAENSVPDTSLLGDVPEDEQDPCGAAGVAEPASQEPDGEAEPSVELGERRDNGAEASADTATESDAVNADEERESPYAIPDAEELRDLFVPEVVELSDGEPAAKEAEQKSDTKKALKADGVFEFVEMLVFTFAAVLLVLSFVFRHSVVDGGSMKNTLHHGEHLIISDLFYEPEQFDIIVFEDRSTGFDNPMIKRVIALGGDTVEINILGEVRVNGVLLEEEYTYVGNPMYTFREMTYTVPEGHVFVMGDHRDDSYDSRFFGAINEDTILGKVVLRFAPFDKFGKVE